MTATSMKPPQCAAVPSASADEPVPRAVVCLTDHLYRDLAVASDAKNGRFTHHGLTLELGRRPDWLHGGNDADEEWRIEWVKLYEGMDLAYAYGRLGDADLLTTWEDLVESFCDQVPVGHDTSDVSARRVQNWLYAWQASPRRPPTAACDPGWPDAWSIASAPTPSTSPSTSPPSATTARSSSTRCSWSHSRSTNDTDAAEAALGALAENATTDIWADGVHRECSTDYHFIVLRSFLGAIANARRAGLAVPPALARADRPGVRLRTARPAPRRLHACALRR